MTSVSLLSPVDPASLSETEQEKTAPWIVRKLVGSMTGRIVMSSYETLRAAGTNVVCLSPWGDSSPLLLPCIRFRDLAVHGVVVATGGMAAIAAPVMGPVSDAIVSTVGDSILVEMGIHTGFEVATKAANDLIGDGAMKRIVPLHSGRLETTSVKTMTITLRYKHTVEDASLGFFRSSLHKDNSLFSAVKDYFSVGKGWFSPYLFASGRRPIIPRSMKPDVIFCHGPFLSGDYKIGETLMAESASIIVLCVPPSPPPEPKSSAEAPVKASHNHLLSTSELPRLAHFPRSRTPSPEPCLAAVPQPPAPRRLVITVLGMKPHRTFWTTSARPSESVIQYQLLDGCPAVVLPAKAGAPLVAWDTYTLEDLWKISVPQDGDNKGDRNTRGDRFEGTVSVLFEYVELCVEWARVTLEDANATEDEKKNAVKDAVTLVVASAARSASSKEVKKEVDPFGCLRWSANNEYDIDLKFGTFAFTRLPRRG